MTRARWISALGLTLSVALGVALGAQDPPPAETPVPRIDEVEARVAALDADPSLDSDTKASLRDLYGQTITQLKLAAEHDAKAQEFDRLAAGATPLLESIREELKQPPGEATPNAPENATLAQLEQLQSQAEAELAAARAELKEIQDESARRKARRAEIPDHLAAANGRLRKVADSLTATSPDGDAKPEVAAARRGAALAERLAITQEIRRHESELESYDARVELLPAKRDRGLRRESEAAKLASSWREIVAARRTAESERAQQEAIDRRREAARKAPTLRRIAETNEDLAALRTGRDGLNERLRLVNEQLSQRRTELEDLRDRFRSIREKVQLAGLTDAMGEHLRRAYSTLPDAIVYRRNQRVREERLSDAQLLQLKLDDDREELYDVEAKARAAAAEADPNAEREDHAELVGEARALYSEQQSLLDKLIVDYRNYVDRLIELENVTRTLVDAITEYRSYIEERTFAVRSVEGSLIPSPRAFAESIAWLGDARVWTRSISNMGAYLENTPGLPVAGAIAIIVLLLGRRRFRAIERESSEQVRRIGTDSIKWTFAALLQAVLIAIAVPALLYWIGSVMVAAPDQASVVLAGGNALRSVAILLFHLLLLRHVTRSGGLAEHHFRWTEPCRKALRVQSRWFTLSFVPLFAIVMMLQAPWAEESWNDSLGRATLVAASIVLAVFLRKVASPSGPVLAPYIGRNPTSMLVRSRHACYALLVGTPIVVAILAIVGFDFTATEILRRFLVSLEFVLDLALIFAVLVRWLWVERRRLALEQARLRREAAKAEETSTSAPLDEVDIPSINAQTLQLIRSASLLTVLFGLYAIWAQLFPALRQFERVQLWPELRIVDSVEEDRYPVLEGQPLDATGTDATKAKPADPAAATSSTPVAGSIVTPDATTASGAADDIGSHVITLADVGLALILLILTTIAAKNIPGLLEILLLRRLSLEPGARYAITTVARYLTVIIGMSATFGAIGIGWSKVQWLAAALTFGLAFGLQEIFANFVSGLIMLFERPVRIGDTVTVGGVDGRVSRIRMRATTITDYDNRELIVPNKEFITGQLINWTLTDSVTRVVIKVGIAYSSSPTKARDILMRIATESPLVLKSPAPNALFRQFADSALLFELRVYIDNRDHWPQLIDQMHHRIHAEFGKAGIEIAFPQLDVHVRSIEGDSSALEMTFGSAAGPRQDAPT